VEAERDSKGKFVKGHQAHERSGRPKGLAALVRARTRDGAELVDLMLSVLRDEIQDTRVVDRITAAEWLADRGWGKAVQVSELTGEDGGPLLITYVNDWRTQE
jgi:hypothetical protein